MHGKINILVHGSIEEDADDYMGAIIEDYDEEAGVLHLFVDPDEIEARFFSQVEALPTEAWGIRMMNELSSITIIECTWNGHRIINDEDICYLFAENGDETWH